MTPVGCLWVMLAAAPMAEAWPYAVRPLPDGGVEYRFDLTLVKRSGGSADALDAWGEAKVKRFLSALPREVRVKVGPAPVELSGGRGGEDRPLAPSFAASSDEAMASSDPLGRAAPARLRSALHPDEPKVLLSPEAVAYLVRSFELEVVAAVELDSERLRRQLWGEVAQRALRRAASSQGDAREGALLLAGRLAAAGSCLTPGRLAEATRGAPELAQAARVELEALARAPSVRPTAAPWTWRRELGCGWVREQALARPFEVTRAGTSAVLTYLAVLDANPSLRSLEATLRRRRDRFRGGPADEPLDRWRTLTAGKAAQALDGLSDFVERLPIAERQPPGLLALPTTPFATFEASLSAAERATQWEELATAVQDGRVSPTAATWPSAREAALVPFAAPERVDAVQLDASWHDALRASFASLLGGAVVASGGLAEPLPESGERRELLVRLLVPPRLEVVPPGSLYGRLAEALAALQAALQAEGLVGLRAVHHDGPATAPALGEARRLEMILRGLSAIALATPAHRDELAAARQFLSAWRAEPGLRRDVRDASAAALPSGEERRHAVVVGVQRRELSVGFARPPEVEVLGGDESFEVDSSVRQRYLVPLLKAVPAAAPPLTAPLARATVRALVDAVGRDAPRAEVAVQEALLRP